MSLREDENVYTTSLWVIISLGITKRPGNLTVCSVSPKRDEADEGIDMLMDKEPHNMQAQALGALIQKAVSKGASVGPCALLSSKAIVVAQRVSWGWR